MDDTASLRWKIIEVRVPYRREGEKEAVIAFNHLEMCSQVVCERAKHFLKQRLLAAENAVPRATLEASPGLLYAADAFSWDGIRLLDVLQQPPSHPFDLCPTLASESCLKDWRIMDVLSPYASLANLHATPTAFSDRYAGARCEEHSRRNEVEAP